MSNPTPLSDEDYKEVVELSAKQAQEDMETIMKDHTNVELERKVIQALHNPIGWAKAGERIIDGEKYYLMTADDVDNLAKNMASCFMPEVIQERKKARIEELKHWLHEYSQTTSGYEDWKEDFTWRIQDLESNL